jgi:hypothetical protein
MRQVKLVVFLLLAVCALPMAADGVDDIRTAGLSNGRAWTSMTDDMRMSYLIGYLDACVIANPASTVVIDAFHCCKYSEISSGITRFYSTEPAYARIPVPIALRLFLDRAKGVPAEKIAKDADAALAELSKIP